MRGWRIAQSLSYRCLVRPGSRRCLSATAAGPRGEGERVSVPCGSSGSINVDLYNITKLSPSEPLWVYLPPYSTAVPPHRAGAGIDLPLPLFCQGRPTAVIHYRWAGYPPSQDDDSSDPPPPPSPPPTLESSSSPEDELPEGAAAATTTPTPTTASTTTAVIDTPLHWPLPIVDTLQAYGWILENLAPPPLTRRHIYACGSYLSAPLAVSLALTEAYPHEHMAVRGCVAFNGIYNWTMLLPDHPTNKPPNKPGSKNAPVEKTLARGDPPPSHLQQQEDPGFPGLERSAAALFERPDNLFDPFASPCLFLQTAGLHVPRTFTEPTEYLTSASLGELIAAAPDHVSLDEIFNSVAARGPPPKRSPLTFPPSKSTLRVPEMLLLHTAAPAPLLPSPPPPPPPPSPQRRRLRKHKPEEPPARTFKRQAEEFARVVRRSIDRNELRERRRWDEDVKLDSEATRRVQVHDVGPYGDEGGSAEALHQLTGTGNQIVETWLENHVVK